MSRIRLSIDSALENVKLVGMAVNRLCAQALDQRAGDEVELAVVEAVNNCIMHAYLQESGHEVTVELTLGSECVLIEISDHGRSMDWQANNELGKCLSFDAAHIDSIPEGGMGLFLIDSLMDEVGYSSGGGINTLTLSRRTCKRCPVAS